MPITQNRLAEQTAQRTRPCMKPSVSERPRSADLGVSGCAADRRVFLSCGLSRIYEESG